MICRRSPYDDMGGRPFALDTAMTLDMLPLATVPLPHQVNSNLTLLACAFFSRVR